LFSLKYKKSPQDAFLNTWQPAVDAWARGQKVTRLIGFDAGKRDTLRYTHAVKIDDPLYDYRYPLREWGMDREACERRIAAAGLPVPPKSSCWFCIGMTPPEVRDLPVWCLRLIVLVEARAAPRLHTVEGLWRKSTRARPGRMTDFIRHERLLPAEDIDRIISEAPLDLIQISGRRRLDPRRRAPDHAQLDRALQRCRARIAAPPSRRLTRRRIAMSLATAAAGMSEREIIARLNDRCRHGLDRTGRTVITRTCLGTFAKNTGGRACRAGPDPRRGPQVHTIPTTTGPSASAARSNTGARPSISRSTPTTPT
jgi:hypothetical protein